MMLTKDDFEIYNDGDLLVGGGVGQGGSIPIITTGTNITQLTQETTVQASIPSHNMNNNQ